MKRHILVLMVALLLAAAPAAAQYTSYFQGDQINTGGPIEIGSTLVACHNLPWSFPDVEDVYVWHGWLDATPNQLVLRFDVIYSLDGFGRVIGVAPREWREGKAFRWEPGMQAYALIYPDGDDPTRLDVEVVSVHGNYAYLFDAGLVFTGAPPIWWELDLEHWLIQWEILRFSVFSHQPYANTAPD